MQQNHLIDLPEAEDFNANWRFILGDDPGFAKPGFDDSSWRELHLPHDWSVEFPFDQEQGEACTGYLPGGIGWYRKTFAVDAPEDTLYSVLFDGVYNNAEFFINGTSLGIHPYGYTPALFDLTAHLEPPGERNVLAVRVDHSRFADSRWYTGSGIYRDVSLIRKPLLHVPTWGTFVTTPDISAERGRVTLEATARNASTGERRFALHTVFMDPDGRDVAEGKTQHVLAPGAEEPGRLSIDVPSPRCWSPDRPALYRAVTSIVEDGTCVDTHVTTFGIRSIRFDPDEGFFLNGHPTLIKGVCLHHGAGLVGAAVPDGVWRRRLLKLKDLGCNAIRTAHNPASKAFLDLCDEMGFLVQEEFFDEWDYPKDKRLNMGEQHDDFITRGYAEHFQERAEHDLKITMRRDRNHPCIFQWSIGNEIEWTYPRYAKATGYFDAEAGGNYFWTLPPFTGEQIKQRLDTLPEQEHVLARTAHRLARWTREMDTTRPVVGNCILPSVSHVSGYADALDVVGYSYRQVMYDLCHELYPDKVIMGTENLGQWHEWKHVVERPFISGLFFWTGIHYLGEARGTWPSKGSGCGMLDFAGFEHGAFHMIKALWREDEPVLRLATQTLRESLYELDDEGTIREKTPGGWAQRLWAWHDVNRHWNYEDGEQIAVEVYTNCEEVELFLDGRSLGIERLADHEDRTLKWMVPSAAGTLRAKGRHPAGREAADQLVTAGEPSRIELVADLSRLYHNACDVAHVEAQLVDADGHPVHHAEREIAFSVEGPCRPLGVDNGALDNVQAFQSDQVSTARGRALLILQAERKSGEVNVIATSEGLGKGVLDLWVGE